MNGGVVGFFSLEMSAEQLATRILAEQAEVASEKIRRGDMDEEEFRSFALTAQRLEAAPLFIDDTPALPISTVAARARRLKRQHGLDHADRRLSAALPRLEPKGLGLQPGAGGVGDYARA